MPESETSEKNTEKISQPPANKSWNNKLLLIIGIAVVVLLVLGAGGYYANQFFSEEAAEKAIETATGGQADVEQDGDKVSIEADDQKLTIGTDEVPKSFPDDVTIYNGSKVTATTESTDNVSVQLTTSDPVETVHSFYKNDLKGNGWTETSDSTYQDSAVVSGEKGGKSVIVTITRDPDENNTVISIIHTTTS